jgi:hypothetical protein
MQLLGVNTGVLTAADGARILGELAPLFQRGALTLHQPLEIHPLSAAASAYARVAEGSPAKVVLVPDGRLAAGHAKGL